MPTKNLRIGFYGVTVTNTPPVSFEQILRRFENDIPEDETRTLDASPDQPVRLHWVRRSQNLWSGEMLRIRLHEELNRASRRGRVRPIHFDEDEGLGENTAFLYHPATRTI